jgi:hypothetical protein
LSSGLRVKYQSDNSRNPLQKGKEGYRNHNLSISRARREGYPKGFLIGMVLLS